MNPFIGAFVFMLGAMASSFAQLMARRMIILNERRKTALDKNDLSISSILFGRSRCEHCGKYLSIHELIPVFSWFILRGRCSGCGHGIGARAPIYETIAGSFLLSSWYQGHDDILTIALVLTLIVCLVVVSETDMETMTIPNGASMLILVSGLAYQAIHQRFLDGLMASVIGFACFFLIDRVLVRFLLGKKSNAYRFIIGFGDVKFFGAISAWCGLASFAYVPIIAGVLGGMWGIWNRVSFKSWIPYGVFLALAEVIVLNFPTVFAMF